MNWKLILVIALVAYGGLKYFNQSPTGDTLTADAVATKGIVHLNGYQLKALAPFEMQARVLSSKRYFLDQESDLAPVDLALGWGPMADTHITNQIQISQSNRWYRWRVDQFPIPRRDIETHSANMHLIPATPAIEKAIKSAQAGQMVSFTGDLVEATDAKGWSWKSSLTREDTGAGACELVLVKSFSVK